MSKQEFEPMSWPVKNFNMNSQTIEDYDVLKYKEDFIKKLKKKCATKEEFADELRHEFQWTFWSRAEYELVIEITDDNRVFLSPWVGCREPEKARIDVTDDNCFDWLGFAEYHIDKQIYKNEAKIDAWDQLFYQWNNFVEYCWNYRHKWQRRKTND